MIAGREARTVRQQRGLTSTASTPRSCSCLTEPAAWLIVHDEQVEIALVLVPQLGQPLEEVRQVLGFLVRRDSYAEALPGSFACVNGLTHAQIVVYKSLLQASGCLQVSASPMLRNRHMSILRCRSWRGFVWPPQQSRTGGRQRMWT